MSAYVIPLWEQSALPVVGTDAVFPVRRIYCVGRNYAAPAREIRVRRATPRRPEQREREAQPRAPRVGRARGLCSAPASEVERERLERRPWSG